MAEVTREEMFVVLEAIKAKVDGIDLCIREIKRIIQANCEDIAVLKDWRSTQVNSALRQVTDLRIELAKLGVLGGGFGLVLGIAVAILKTVGIL